MKALFSILATGFLTTASATFSWAQQHPGVYTSSQEYVHNQPAHPGAVGALPASLAYLEVVNAHTHAVHRVPLAQVWGYANAKGQGFRLVEHKAYAIQPQQDGLITYSRQRAIQHSRSKHIVTEHFYSETLDGKLHALTKRGLKQHQAAAN
ncbi:MAG: hypothetical protein EOO62_18600 [Hymenobacter sp.]|nr:MAG: hypothetical protein EOO62_18600 [Hymenobacter sp.]